MVGENGTSWYLKLSRLLRRHGTPIAAVVSAFFAVLTGIIAIYTNVHNLKMMELTKKQIDANQYNQYQGSIALAWRTIGAANGQAFEIGQSVSLLYLALNNELAGNVTLNQSLINFTTPNAAKLIAEYNNNTFVSFNLGRSELCGTEIQKWPLQQLYTAIDFSYSHLNMATLRGTFISDDFLSVDARGARFIDLQASNSRFAGADLRRIVIHGGIYTDVDFQGADLRESTTQRGVSGFGATYGGAYVDTYSEYTVGKIMWPPLFDMNIGINEMLNSVNRSPMTPYENLVIDFSNSNFNAADVRGADLCNSNISQAQINQSCADETTKLPAEIRIAHTSQQPPLFSEKLDILRAPLVPSSGEEGCATTSKRAAPSER